jgi:hypothetical protein
MGAQKNAYVTLVMKGDYYVPGAIVLAQSLRETKTLADIACMVTNDVSEERIQILGLFFDRVFRVEYIRAECKPMTNEMQKLKYGSWMGESLTTFRCLGLGLYKKVLFLDADVCVIQNMDLLFKLRAPAGTFDTYFGRHIRAKQYGKGRKQLGDIIPKQAVMAALSVGNHVAIGNCMLFETRGGKMMDLFMRYVQEFISVHGTVGFHRQYAVVNEQMIAHFFAEYMSYDWTHIDSRFQNIPWKPICQGPSKPFLYHYLDVKPWIMNESEWPDLSVWWSAARRAIKTHPECVECFDQTKMPPDVRASAAVAREVERSVGARGGGMMLAL